MWSDRAGLEVGVRGVLPRVVKDGLSEGAELEL